MKPTHEYIVKIEEDTCVDRVNRMNSPIHVRSETKGMVGLRGRKGMHPGGKCIPVLLVLLGAMSLLPSVIPLVQAQNVEALVVHVETDSNTYSLGAPIAIKISATNTGTTALVFDWPTSCVFDLAVTDSQGNEVFRLSRNVVCAQVLTQVKVEPGETRTYDARWNQISNAGGSVGPGEYDLMAWLVGRRSENVVTLHLGDSTATTTMTAQGVNEFVSIGSLGPAVGAVLLAAILGIVLHRRRIAVA